MWGSSIEGEEKERGFISGNSFPLILRKAFSPSVVFVFLSFLSFSFIFWGDYKGALPFIVIIVSFAVNYKGSLFHVLEIKTFLWFKERICLLKKEKEYICG